jgi:hypothetical protein
MINLKVEAPFASLTRSRSLASQGSKEGPAGRKVYLQRKPQVSIPFASPAQGGLGRDPGGRGFIFSINP